MISKFFSKAFEKQTVNKDLQRVGLKTLLGVRLTKISLSYFGIMILGIALFVVAKKDIDKNRQNQMKVRQELARLDSYEKYPSRYDIYKSENVVELQKQK